MWTSECGRQSGSSVRVPSGAMRPAVRSPHPGGEVLVAVRAHAGELLEDQVGERGVRNVAVADGDVLELRDGLPVALQAFEHDAAGALRAIDACGTHRPGVSGDIADEDVVDLEAAEGSGTLTLDVDAAKVTGLRVLVPRRLTDVARRLECRRVESRGLVADLEVRDVPVLLIGQLEHVVDDTEAVELRRRTVAVARQQDGIGFGARTSGRQESCGVRSDHVARLTSAPGRVVVGLARDGGAGSGPRAARLQEDAVAELEHGCVHIRERSPRRIGRRPGGGVVAACGVYVVGGAGARRRRAVGDGEFAAGDDQGAGGSRRRLVGEAGERGVAGSERGRGARGDGRKHGRQERRDGHRDSCGRAPPDGERDIDVPFGEPRPAVPTGARYRNIPLRRCGIQKVNVHVLDETDRSDRSHLSSRTSCARLRGAHRHRDCSACAAVREPRARLLARRDPRCCLRIRRRTGLGRHLRAQCPTQIDTGDHRDDPGPGIQGGAPT